MSPAAERPLAGVFAHRTPNLGDDLQAYACLAHLNRVDLLLDRDRLADTPAPEPARPVAFIANSWFLLGDDLRPPPGWMRPLWHGFRPDERLLADATWLQRLREEDHPVGCRDLHVLRRLTAAGVPARFSGCISLSLGRHWPAPARRDGVVLLDVPAAAEPALPREWTDGAVRLTTYAPDGLESPLDRWAMVAGLVQQLATARLVVTRRLHAALPAAGLGTRVVALPDPAISFARERFDGFGGVMPVVFSDGDLASLQALRHIDDVPLPHRPDAVREAHDALMERLRGWGLAAPAALPSTPLDTLGGLHVTVRHPWPHAGRARFRLVMPGLEQALPVLAWQGDRVRLALRTFPGLSRLALRLQGRGWPGDPWHDLGPLTEALAPGAAAP